MRKSQMWKFVPFGVIVSAFVGRFGYQLTRLHWRVWPLYSRIWSTAPISTHPHLVYKGNMWRSNLSKAINPNKGVHLG